AASATPFCIAPEESTNRMGSSEPRIERRRGRVGCSALALRVPNHKDRAQTTGDGGTPADTFRSSVPHSLPAHKQPLQDRGRPCASCTAARLGSPTRECRCLISRNN